MACPKFLIRPICKRENPVIIWLNTLVIRIVALHRISQVIKCAFYRYVMKISKEAGLPENSRSP